LKLILPVTMLCAEPLILAQYTYIIWQANANENPILPMAPVVANVGSDD